VEEGAVPRPRADGAESVHLTPNLDLSEDVFTDTPETIVETAEEAAEAGDEAEPAVLAAEEAPDAGDEADPAALAAEEASIVAGAVPAAEEPEAVERPAGEEPAAEPPVRDSGPVEGVRENREVPPTPTESDT
jgi:hypothetical protein